MGLVLAARSGGGPAPHGHGGARSGAGPTGEGAGARAVDDEEPEREDGPAENRRGAEDLAHHARALVTAGGTADEDPGIVHALQQRQRPEQQREQRSEGDEDAEADAARQVVDL